MEELIIQSKQGNQEAFTQLILSIKLDLYKIAKTRLSSDYDIRDAIQETMIIVYTNLKKLKDNSKFKSWVIKILINECNKIYKKNKNKNKINKSIILESFDNSDNSIQEANSKIDFNMLINCLDYEERIIITLFYNNSYSCLEISKILNKNINTIKSKLNRARNKIKKNYEGDIKYE